VKIIGIDPGHLGGIVIIDDNSVVLEAYPMPLVGDTYDYHKMLQLFIDNKDSCRSPIWTSVIMLYASHTCSTCNMEEEDWVTANRDNQSR